MIQFICVCGITYNAEDNQANQTFVCPTCQQAVIIPAAPAPAPAPSGPEVSESAQGWAGGFFSGQAPAGPPPEQSEGTKALLELAAEGDALDSLLPGSGSQAPEPTGEPEHQTFSLHDDEPGLVAPGAPGAAPPPAAPPMHDPTLPEPPPDVVDFMPEQDEPPSDLVISFEESGEVDPGVVETPGSKRRPTGTSASASRRRKTGSRQTGSAVSKRRATSSRRRTTDTRAPEPPESPAANKNIIDCAACGEQIARFADECPFCGAFVEKGPGFAERHAQTALYVKYGVGVLGLLILIGVAVKMMTGGSGDTKPIKRGPKVVIDEPDKPKDPKKDPDGKDPKKDPKDKDPKDKDPKDKDPKDKDPKKDPKDEDPYAEVRRDIESLMSATDPEAVAKEIKEFLSKVKDIDQVCNKTIRVDRAAIIAGRCYRVLMRYKNGEERKRVLKEALSSKAMDAPLFATELIVEENIEDLRSAFKDEDHRRRGNRVAALWGRALLDVEPLPGAADLEYLTTEGESLDARPRLALLRLAAGDAGAIEEALKAFRLKSPKIRAFAQKAFKLYTGKDDILLDNLEDDAATEAVAQQWSQWIEGYKPSRELLAKACVDPSRVTTTGPDRLKVMAAARQEKFTAMLSALGKGSELMPAIKVFTRAEPMAATEEGTRTLTLLCRTLASSSDAEFLRGWLGRVKERAIAKRVAAAALTICPKDTLDAVLELTTEEGGELLPLKTVAELFPDVGRARSERLDELKETLANERGQDAEAVWCLLASTGSKLCEGFVLDQKNPPSAQTAVLGRLGDKRLEGKILEIATGEEKLKTLSKARAASLLMTGGSAEVADDCLKLLGKDEEDLSLTASQILIRTATPKMKSSLLRHLDHKNNRVAVNVAVTLASLRDPKVQKSLKKAFEREYDDATPAVRRVLKGALFNLGSTIKEGPRKKEIEQLDKWLKKYEKWLNSDRKQRPPDLPRKTIERLGKVGKSDDVEALTKVLQATESLAQKVAVIATFGKLDVPDQVPMIKGFIIAGRRSRGTAAMAIARLHRRGGKEAIPDLRYTLQESDNLVADDGEMLVALSVLDQKVAFETVKELHKRERRITPQAMIGVAFALARAEEDAGVPLLKKYIWDPNSRVREGVCEGIVLASCYKDAKVSSEVEGMLKPLCLDEEESVRCQAIVALLVMRAKFASGFVYGLLQESPPCLLVKRETPVIELLDPDNYGESYREQVFRVLNRGRLYYTDALAEGCRREALRQVYKFAGKLR